MNEQIVIDRIRSRLEELGESSFDVSVRIGKHRNFVNDLIVGRKKSFAANLLPELAAALNCDVQWLVGLQDAPRTAGEQYDTLPVSGTVEAGVWRKAGKDPAIGTWVPIRPDARYPASQQRVWLVRGSVLGGEMLGDGTAILTVDAVDQAVIFNIVSNGDLLVVERKQGDMVERTILTARRDATGIALHGAGGDAEEVVWTTPGRFPVEGMRIAGLVLQISRFRA